MNCQTPLMIDRWKCSYQIIYEKNWQPMSDFIVRMLSETITFSDEILLCDQNFVLKYQFLAAWVSCCIEYGFILGNKVMGWLISILLPLVSHRRDATLILYDMLKVAVNCLLVWFPKYSQKLFFIFFKTGLIKKIQ